MLGYVGEVVCMQYRVACMVELAACSVDLGEVACMVHWLGGLHACSRL